MKEDTKRHKFYDRILLGTSYLSDDLRPGESPKTIVCFAAERVL